MQNRAASGAGSPQCGQRRSSARARTTCRSARAPGSRCRTRGTETFGPWGKDTRVWARCRSSDVGLRSSVPLALGPPGGAGVATAGSEGGVGCCGAVAFVTGSVRRRAARPMIGLVHRMRRKAPADDRRRYGCPAPVRADLRQALAVDDRDHSPAHLHRGAVVGRVPEGPDAAARSARAGRRDPRAAAPRTPRGSRSARRPEGCAAAPRPRARRRPRRGRRPAAAPGCGGRATGPSRAHGRSGTGPRARGRRCRTLRPRSAPTRPIPRSPRGSPR